MLNLDSGTSTTVQEDGQKGTRRERMARLLFLSVFVPHLREALCQHCYEVRFFLVENDVNKSRRSFGNREELREATQSERQCCIGEGFGVGRKRDEK